jgi:alkylmercury lyase
MGDDRDAGDLLRADLNEVALRLARAGFAALWNGASTLPADLLGDHGRLAAEVAGELASRGRAELDDHGRLVGIHGLTLRVTRHRFVSDGRSHHTWCAFDAVGIPSALGIDAVAHTACPACGQSLHVAITDGVPADGPAVLWLPAATGENLMAEFCSRADLYCDREHLGRSIEATVTGGQVVTLPEASALGQHTWADMSGIDLA